MKTMITVVFLIVLNLSSILAQNPTLDSLWNVFNNSTDDSLKVELLIESIGYEYENINLDSALSTYNKGLKAAQQKGFASAEARAFMYIAIMNGYLGKYDEAIDYYRKSLEKYLQMSTSANSNLSSKGFRGAAANYNNLSNIYASMANYPLALENLQKALKIFETLDEKETDKSKTQYKEGLISCYTNIAGIHIQLSNFDLAENYLNSAINILDMLLEVNPNNINLKISLIDANVNFGIVFFEKNDLIKSKKYYIKALALAEELDLKPKIAVCLNNMANIEYELKNYTNSLNLYEKTLKYREEFADLRGISLVSVNMSKIYFELCSFKGLNPNDQKTYIRKSKLLAERALSISREIKSFSIENEAAAMLLELHSFNGNFKEALGFSRVFIATKDSMFREEKTKALTEMETRYQTEKKQQEIEKQQLLIDKQDVEMRRQRLQRNFSITGALLLALLVLVVYRGYKQKKESNLVITEKNTLLEQANEEIAAQRDLVVEQKEHIEVIHEELTSSIRYARRIQGAVLPSAVQMNELLGDHFVLFKPKDIVSGDFYWATRVKQWLVFCVADCTGHGVPGAFMSMLGVSFLNEIVHKEHIITASEALNHLRDSVIAALKQRGDSSEQKDGMDMGLCVIDTKTLQMQFAGGYNPCWVIPNLEHTGSRIIEPKSDDDTSSENPVIQLKPDKMPIAIHKHMESYTNHLLQLYPGDRVYLMSDGFQDQFGGDSGKKFMVKNLRELVAANANLPMVEQQKLLETTLDHWMGSTEQVDDITIMGVKV